MDQVEDAVTHDNRLLGAVAHRLRRDELPLRSAPCVGTCSTSSFHDGSARKMVKTMSWSPWRWRPGSQRCRVLPDLDLGPSSGERPPRTRSRAASRAPALIREIFGPGFTSGPRPGALRNVGDGGRRSASINRLTGLRGWPAPRFQVPAGGARSRRRERKRCGDISLA